MLELSGAELKPICGIYEIKNIETGQCYIGMSIQIPSRWATHFTELDTGKHSLLLMQRDWDLYGPDAFKASVIKIVPNIHNLSTEEDYAALERLDSGVKLYNAAIAGWVNEEERAARLERKRAEEAEKRRILQLKRESQNEKRNQRGGNRGDKAPVQRKRGVQGRGRVSGDSASTPVESLERGIRKPQAGVLFGKPEVDTTSGTERPAPKSVDEDGRRGKRDNDPEEALSIFDREVAAGFTIGLTEEEADQMLRGMREDLMGSFRDAMDFAGAIRAVATEDELRIISDICDPLSLLINFTDDADFERARAAADAGGDRVRWLLSKVDKEMEDGI